MWLDGALLALASGKAERRQVHPLRQVHQQTKKCIVYSVGAAETAAPPERTPIKNLPRISQMRTDISCWDTLIRKLPQIARMCTD